MFSPKAASTKLETSVLPAKKGGVEVSSWASPFAVTLDKLLSLVFLLR